MGTSTRARRTPRSALEHCFAALEGGYRGCAFASGLAGQDIVVRALLKHGDHVVIPSDAYGGTYPYFNQVARPGRIDHTIPSILEVDSVRAAIRPGVTKLVGVETPSNPLLNIADIGDIAKSRTPSGTPSARPEANPLPTPVTASADLDAPTRSCMPHHGFSSHRALTPQRR